MNFRGVLADRRKDAVHIARIGRDQIHDRFVSERRDPQTITLLSTPPLADDFDQPCLDVALDVIPVPRHQLVRKFPAAVRDVGEHQSTRMLYGVAVTRLACAR